MDKIRPNVLLTFTEVEKYVCVLTDNPTQIRFIQHSPCAHCVPVCLCTCMLSVDYLLNWSLEQMVTNMAIISAFLSKIQAYTLVLLANTKLKTI